MKVLMAVSECVPFVKTGGLADVAGSLPKGLAQYGVESVVVMPKYVAIDSEFKDMMETVCSFEVEVGWRKQYCGVETLVYKDVRYYFLDNMYYFDRSGLYGYGDDAERFAFFCRAVLELLMHIDYVPDIIHAHDWHTSLIPVYLNAIYKKRPLYKSFYKTIKTMLTIHNLSYQGVFPTDVMYDVVGLADYMVNPSDFEFYGGVNFMKAGIIHCDAVTTVSKTYANEIQYPYFGEKLDGLIQSNKHKLSGIVNGIDYEIYNPSTDPYLVQNYTNELDLKRKNKIALQEALGLPVDPEKPMIAMISRLVKAKGVDLITHIMDELMWKEEVQFVLLGTGDYLYEHAFLHFQRKYPDCISINNTFNNRLANRIYAGTDMILMPSLFEPCGITQLIGLRYGSIPIVRETGGLFDTITPFDEADGKGNGFSFTNYNAHDMLHTIRRALRIYEDKELWQKLVNNAIESDFSWSNSAREYYEIYQGIVAPKY